MSRIFKKLNIGDDAPPAAAGPNLTLVPQAELEPHVPSSKSKSTRPRSVAAVLVLLIVMIGGVGAYFSGYLRFPKNLPTEATPAIQSGAAAAVDSKPDADGLIHAEALQLYRAKDYVKAIERFDGLLQRHPKDAALMNNLGLAYVKIGEFVRAEKQFTEALKLEPKDSSVYNNLGSLKMAQLDSDEAISYFYQAILYHPEMTEPHLNLAKAFELAGRPMEAIPEYQYYLDHAGPAADPAIRKLIEKRVVKLNSYSRYLAHE